MKFQLVLAALVGLVASASFYPPISSADLADHAIGQHGGQDGQQPAHANYHAMFESGSEFNDILSRQPRYLRVDNVTVVNATSMLYGAFMFGSITLGVLSVLNDAALSVAKHKRVTRRKKLRKNFQNNDVIDDPADDTIDDTMNLDAESEYARYEQEVREYKRKYQEYLDQYSEWAKAYGQDPTPPEGSFPSGPPARSKRYFLIFKNPQKSSCPLFYRLTLPKYVKAEMHYLRPHRGWLLKRPLKPPFFHGNQRFVCWLILISSVSIFVFILNSSFLNI